MNRTNPTHPISFQEGLRAFNDQAFYEAHEYFETAWRQTNGKSREFYRAMLHICGGFYRLTQNRPNAARKFFAHAIKWLNQFPDLFDGFDLLNLKEALSKLINAIDRDIPANEIIKHQHLPIQAIGDGDPE